MDKQKRNDLSKLLEIDTHYLIDYISDLVVENDDDILMAINTKDREYLESIIEKYIY